MWGMKKQSRGNSRFQGGTDRFLVRMVGISVRKGTQQEEKRC